RHVGHHPLCRDHARLHRPADRLARARDLAAGAYVAERERAMDADFWRCSTVELGALLARREISPVELLAATWARIDRLNPSINAIITRDGAGAQAAAAASERRHLAGGPLGPLDGVPFTVKDNLLAKGLPTVWGSAL